MDEPFQHTPLSHTGTNDPYKAYMNTIQKTNKTTQQGVLISQLFYKDNGPVSFEAKTGPNGGLFNRHLATTGGKV